MSENATSPRAVILLFALAAFGVVGCGTGSPGMASVADDTTETSSGDVDDGHGVPDVAGGTPDSDDDLDAPTDESATDVHEESDGDRSDATTDGDDASGRDIDVDQADDDATTDGDDASGRDIDVDQADDDATTDGDDDGEIGADAHDAAGDAAVDTTTDAPTDTIDDIAADTTPDAPADTPSDIPDDTPPDSDTDDDVVDPGPWIIHMATDGDDGLDGSTPDRAIATLARAHELVSTAATARDVEIRIAPGVYLAQQVTWTFTMPEHTITFRRRDDEGERPVFDGCLVADVTDPATECPGGTWFQLRHSAGEETNLHFWYVQVQRYQTAISLNANRNDEAASNGSNRIYGCYFYRIGNVFNPALSPSTAAVRLVNSDDNEIANTHFVEIVNTSSAGLLHAIYVAHMSDRNQILRNRFLRNSGDPIRVRDYSNDNVVNDNRFIQTGIEAAYTTWYCDHDVRDDCTKPAPECPSWGNQFRNNSLDGNYACDRLSGFHYYLDDSTTGCAPPSPDAQRLRTSGNSTSETPCTDG